MKKVLYTHGKLADCGTQIIVRAIPEINSGFSEDDLHFLKTFPEVKNIINQVYESITLAIYKDAGEPPRTGDVIWVETSGGKLIANCVIFDKNYNLDLKAVGMCLESVLAKAEMLNQPSIGMNLFGAELFDGETIKDGINRWRTIAPMIENVFKDIQVVSFVSDMKLLDGILNNLPGKGDVHASCNGKVIRFRRHAQDNDK